MKLPAASGRGIIYVNLFYRPQGRGIEPTEIEY